ncbi:MAG: PD40 domain-containing protein [Planctomycetes bacterium]|nr:PD40 domain-containing protein [Planctomycetota bacterium]
MKKWTLRILVFVLIAVGGGAAWHLWPRSNSYLTDADLIHQPARTAAPREILWQPPTRLPDFINFEGDNYEPRISADGLTLFFVHGKAGANADIYISNRLRDGWDDPRPLEAVNSTADDLGPTPSADGESLYFYSDRDGGLGGYDLWVSRRANGLWNSPRNLGPQVNSPFNDYGPAPSPDGETLYFSSNRPSGRDPNQPNPNAWPATLREDFYHRTYDLYSAPIVSSEIGGAVALDALNSPFNEGAPTVSPFSDFLYFASDRPGGEGGFDLYRSRRVRGQFEPPGNLGTPINSPANELDPGLSLGGYALHFSSDRASVDNSAEQSRDTASKRYALYQSTSREVFAESERVEQAAINWAGLWSAIGPNLLWAMLALLALLLMVALFRVGKDRKLSLMAKCLLASIAAHLFLMFMLNTWQVTTKVMVALKRGPIQVALGDGGSGVGGRAIAVQLTRSMGQSPQMPSAMPEGVRFASDIKTEVSFTPLPVNASLKPIFLEATSSVSPDFHEANVNITRTIERIAAAALPPPNSPLTPPTPQSPEMTAVTEVSDSPQGPQTTQIPASPRLVSDGALLPRIPTSRFIDPTLARGNPINVESTASFVAIESPTDAHVGVSLPKHRNAALEAKMKPDGMSAAALPSATSSFASTIAVPLTVQCGRSEGPSEPTIASTLGTNSAAFRTGSAKASVDVPSPIAVQMIDVSAMKSAAATPGSRNGATSSAGNHASDNTPDSGPNEGTHSFVDRLAGGIAKDTMPSKGTSGRGSANQPPVPIAVASSAPVFGSPGEFSMPSACSKGSIACNSAENTEHGIAMPGSSAQSSGRAVLSVDKSFPSKSNVPRSGINLNPMPQVALSDSSFVSAKMIRDMDSTAPSGSSRGTRIGGTQSDNVQQPPQVTPATALGGSLVALNMKLGIPTEEIDSEGVGKGSKTGNSDGDGTASNSTIDPKEVIGLIRGRATDANTGRPLPGAIVQLDLPDRPPLTIKTNPNGRYRLSIPNVPDFFALSASRDGYVPNSVNVDRSKISSSAARVDFPLAPMDSSVIAIEAVPDIHHLGDNRFDGDINSQFQKVSEGALYQQGFTIQQSQLPPRFTHGEIHLLAKGVQRNHRIYVNETLLKKRLNHSPEDGSFGEFVASFETSTLSAGTNTFRIVAAPSEDDIDDFEFVNVRILLFP